MSVETGGQCEARGKSGEVGCLQFLPATWRRWSTEVLGYVPEMSQVNELYVAGRMIDAWLSQGLSNEQVATMWNSGGTTHRSGINRYGIAYDTRAYARSVLATLKSIY